MICRHFPIQLYFRVCHYEVSGEPGELQLCVIHQLMVYNNNFNILRGSVRTIRNAAGLLVADKEIGLEVNPGKTKYMSGHQNVRRSHNMKVDNRNFARVEVIKHWQTNITILNCVQEEVNSIMKSGSICCLSLQNILSSILLSNNTNSKITAIKHCLLFCVGVKLGRSH